MRVDQGRIYQVSKFSLPRELFFRREQDRLIRLSPYFPMGRTHSTEAYE